jgi:hypothetical protein
MPNTTEVSLKIGTWVIVPDDGVKLLGQILQIQKDDDGIIWFKCSKKADLMEPSFFQEGATFSVSASKFEQGLAKAIPDAQADILHARIIDFLEIDEADEAEEPEDEEVEEDARGIEPDFDLSNQLRSAVIEKKQFEFPVDSGKTKTAIELFSSNPRLQWPLIDKIIEETGHLIFTTVDHKTTSKLLNYKVEWELTHVNTTLEVNQYYRLINPKAQSTIGKYVGDNYWVLSPENYNNIDALHGCRFGRIPTEVLNDYIVEKIDISEYSDLGRELDDTTNEIHNVAYYGRRGNTEVSTSVDGHNATIPAERLSTNWQKAFTYNYYKGIPLDPRLDVANFAEKEAIKKLAEYKNDTDILAQF